jgi:hypothetical protein
MPSDSLVKITGLPRWPAAGLGIVESCARQPEEMRDAGLQIIRESRRHVNIRREVRLLYIESYFEAALDQTWLGNRTVKRILDVCFLKLKVGSLEAILFEYGGPEAVVGLYLAVCPGPKIPIRKWLIRMIEGWDLEDKKELAKNVKGLHINPSIVAWIHLKFVKATSTMSPLSSLSYTNTT